MSRYNQTQLANMNSTGVEWKDMTDAQKNALRNEWDKVAGDPKQLYCTCPRTMCRNNHNCQFCAALHRYYDGVPDCLRPLIDEMQKDVPQEYQYNMHYKIQAVDNEGIVDPHDAEKSRYTIVKDFSMDDIQALFDKWSVIVRNPKNRACTCKQADCRYHGNCVKCIALHRAYRSFPACMDHIADLVEQACDAYHAAHPAGADAE